MLKNLCLHRGRLYTYGENIHSIAQYHTHDPDISKCEAKQMVIALYRGTALYGDTMSLYSALSLYSVFFALFGDKMLIICNCNVAPLYSGVAYSSKANFITPPTEVYRVIMSWTLCTKLYLGLCTLFGTKAYIWRSY